MHAPPSWAADAPSGVGLQTGESAVAEMVYRRREKEEGESRHLRCALDGRELVTVQVGFILRGTRGELAGQLYRQQFRCQLHVSRL